jgi:hypothetical protein
MSKAGSKKDTVIGATRVEIAIILFVADWLQSSIFLHTRYLSDIFTPPQL